MKQLSILLMIFIILFTVTGCKEVKFDESKKELIVGLECDYAPFNWTETSKSETNYPISNVSGAYAEGYDVQIAKLICKELGYKLVIKKISWDGLIPALDAGTIDAIIAGMSPTDKRKLSINFTDAYYNSTHVILTMNDSKYANATTFAELDGAKVIGQKNTLYDTLAGQIASKNKNCKYLPALATVPLIVNALNSGVADLTVLEEPVAKGLVARDSSLTYFRLNENFDLEESDTIVSIGIRKVDKTLQSKLNSALATITETTRNNIMQSAVDNQPIEG